MPARQLFMSIGGKRQSFSPEPEMPHIHLMNSYRRTTWEIALGEMLLAVGLKELPTANLLVESSCIARLHRFRN